MGLLKFAQFQTIEANLAPKGMRHVALLRDAKRCAFDGCERKHYANGWCRAHDHQMRRHGEVRPLRVPQSVCTFDGCDRPHESHGLCNGHNIQRRSGRELAPLRAWTKGRGCLVDGCDAKHWAKGMCQVHYNRHHWRTPSGRRARQLAFTRRRASKRQADVRVVSDRDWARLVARYDGLCAYCRECPWEHRDHVIPLSRGGRESIGNLLPACGGCNVRKKAKLLIEWRVAG